MTKAAAREGFERFVDDAIDITRTEFSVSRALTGTTGPGSSIIDRLIQNADAVDRKVIQPELQAYREEIIAQFFVVLEYAATPEADPETFHDRILARDAYYAALRPDVSAEKRATIRSQLLERQLGLGEAIRPLVSSNEESFWPAVQDVFSQAKAESFVEAEFRFAGPLTTYPEAFQFQATLDPQDILGGVFGVLSGGLPSLTFDFTEEATRAIVRAERTVIDRTKREVRRRY